jgi:DNA-binding transcriptional MerR regulator
MRNGYTNSDLEKILGIKGYVIRYWQKEIPLIQPRRDERGRFVYSARDLELFLRLKHLIQDKKYTVEGARDQLLVEASNPNTEMLAALSELRANLIDIYFLNKERTNSDNQNE